MDLEGSLACSLLLHPHFFPLTQKTRHPQFLWAKPTSPCWKKTQTLNYSYIHLYGCISDCRVAAGSASNLHNNSILLVSKIANYSLQWLSVRGYGRGKKKHRIYKSDWFCWVSCGSQIGRSHPRDPNCGCNFFTYSKRERKEAVLMAQNDKEDGTRYSNTLCHHCVQIQSGALLIAVCTPLLM